MTEISTKYYTSDQPRIDPDVKAKWVAALRSGEYRQGKKMLKTPEGSYCCLGVYCAITGVRESLQMQFVATGNGFTERMVPSFGDPGLENFVIIPPNYEIALADPTSENIDYPFVGEEQLFSCTHQFSREWNVDLYEKTFLFPHTLPGLNDSGFTFDQIADIIDYFL